MVKPTTFKPDLESRVEKLEDGNAVFAGQMEIMGMRLKVSEDTAKRLEDSVKEIKDNQSKTAGIVVDTNLKIIAIYNAFGGEDGLKKAESRNKRIDARFATSDSFLKTLWNTFSKGLSLLLILAFVIGALVLLGVNLNNTMAIVPKLRLEASTQHKIAGE